MASLVTCIVSSAAWCCCTATASLFTSCCGNDKASTVPPGETSGRKRSVLLLVLAIALAFAFQYGLAPFFQNSDTSNYVVDAWTDGCEDFGGNDELQERCSGNAGVYRVAGSTTLFFALAAIAAACKPTANRDAWPAKYVLFLFLVGATVFIPNEPLFSDIYLQIGRIGAVIFILFQQIIIIDLAYNWNESWVTKANVADEEEAGSGKKWLYAILFSCAVMFIGSLAAIVLLFVYFSGCGTNETFISITLVMSVIVTGAQLSGEEASLLTSASIVSYATYLCYTAVSKNPDGECNPYLGEQDVLGIALGVGVTLIGLAWTGWSYTAGKRVEGDSDATEEPLVEDKNEAPDEERRVTGIVTDENYGSNSADEEAVVDAPAEAESDTKSSFSNSWKLNVILGLVSCWFAMALTGWGSIDSGGNAANPDVGKVSMWMIIASQWLVLVLYLWTLVAPRLFPDREFS